MMIERLNLRASHIASASILAIALSASPATAQQAATPAATTAPDTAVDAPIVVSGIRASLRSSEGIKRSSLGVVDAITAEDIGKFPDTNLAESLQRITGVSIDRNSGEGSTVTVRGFGPEFNLVLLNGRQMPTSTLGDGASAPSSRSFDFGNLASEGIAGVEVYKSGRASLSTGGIGSVINIKTARPFDRAGFRGSFGVKGVYDTSRFEGKSVTPEVSGIISDTFADNRIGILLSGSYQDRKGSQAGFSAGWREGYLGSENNWGSLAPLGTPAAANITNRPGPNDVYQVTQNAGYDFTTFERKRLNGQAVLQVKPTDTMVATVDYTFSQNTVDARTNSIGVWFNHGDTSSSWTNGPAAGPNFYTERFTPASGKDLAITGAVAANRSINRSLGGNLKWDGPGNKLHLELDAHHSTAESKPTSPFGSHIAVGSAIYGVVGQTVDYTTPMPVISVTMAPGADITAANIRPAGNAFSNAYFRDEINEAAFKGSYDFDSAFIKSLDFGVTHTENKVRSAFGNIQNDTWGGTLSAADTPDSLYTLTNLPHDLAGVAGSNAAGIIPNYFKVDTTGLVTLLNNKLGICATSTVPGSCLASYTTDRSIREETWSPFIQSLHTFDLGENPGHLRLGLRYETTKVAAASQVPIPQRTLWSGGNETSIDYGSPAVVSAASLTGRYHNWLPAVDFDMSPIKNVKLRASYSQTITRPDYASMQGGTSLASPIRIGGSTASSGNPGLLPYKAINIDLSSEWYYTPTSYISVGYFHKVVKNFIAQTQVNQSAFGLTNAAAGAHATEARTALGPDASAQALINYIAAHYPTTAVTDSTGNVTGIIGQASDPLVNFITTIPTNSAQQDTIHGWEFAIQHNFWETGFGTILNYTVVKSDHNYDNTLNHTITQFAVPGASNSANAVLFYDKHGLQARVAYNWRAQFLAGYGVDPYYISSYGQFDVSASYEIRKGFTVFGEGINITNASRQGHERNSQTVFFSQPGYARWAAGARFTF